MKVSETVIVYLGQSVSIIVRNLIPVAGIYLFDWPIGLYLFYIVVELLLVSLASPLRYYWLSDGMRPVHAIPGALMLGGLNIVVNLLPGFVLLAIALGLTPDKNGTGSMNIADSYLLILENPVEFSTLLVSVIWDQVIWRRKIRIEPKSTMAEFIHAMIFGWGIFLLLLNFGSQFRGDTDKELFAEAMLWFCVWAIIALELFLAFGVKKLNRVLKKFFPLAF